MTNVALGLFIGLFVGLLLTRLYDYTEAKVHRPVPVVPPAPINYTDDRRRCLSCHLPIMEGTSPAEIQQLVELGKLSIPVTTWVCQPCQDFAMGGPLG